MLIDSHCHLDFPDFAADRDGVVARARAAGRRAHDHDFDPRREIRRDLARSPKLYPDVFCTVGEHPHEAHEEPEVAVDELVALARASEMRRHRRSRARLSLRQTRRATSPRGSSAPISRPRARPACRSSSTRRDADADMAAILDDEMGKGPFKAVLHCFTSSRELAETGLALGLYVSFSGIVTFKNSRRLRDIARDRADRPAARRNRCAVLAPVPHRGKRNEPAFVAATAAVLAEVKGVSIADARAR